MKFRCEKCGSTMPSVKQVNSSTGLYCRDCGAWQKWLFARKEIAEIQSYIKNNLEPNDNRAERCFIKRKNITTIKCARCNTLLHTSGTPTPQGQFNLLYAVYCPKCGAELI